MSTSKSHYRNVLSPVYSWMYGGHDAGLARNRSFFDAQRIRPAGSKVAIDLGAGSGFQSIPLAELGFSVVAIDLDAGLLAELRDNAGDLPVRTVEADLREFTDHCDNGVELVICMTDTILHLESIEDVILLFRDVWDTLEPSGQFILTFRDLSRALFGLDRFIPVRSDATTIFTCFLEYEDDSVKVHDLVYRWEEREWRLRKGVYRKLRLSPRWVEQELRAAGFDKICIAADNGSATIVARRA